MFYPDVLASIENAACVYAEWAVVIARGIVRPVTMILARRALVAPQARAAQPGDVEDNEPNAELIEFFRAYNTARAAAGGEGGEETGRTAGNWRARRDSNP
ncbi:MAG: hypothetical protein ACLQME_07250 [Alphaproteobacteria bacterium]